MHESCRMYWKCQKYFWMYCVHRLTDRLNEVNDSSLFKWSMSTFPTEVGSSTAATSVVSLCQKLFSAALPMCLMCGQWAPLARAKLWACSMTSRRKEKRRGLRQNGKAWTGHTLSLHSVLSHCLFLPSPFPISYQLQKGVADCSVLFSTDDDIKNKVGFEEKGKFKSKRTKISSILSIILAVLCVDASITSLHDL